MEKRKPKIGDRVVCNSVFFKRLQGYTGIITDINTSSTNRLLCTVELDKEFKIGACWMLNKFLFLYNNEFELIVSPYQQLMLFEV